MSDIALDATRDVAGPVIRRASQARPCWRVVCRQHDGRPRVIVALDLLCWLDQRGQDLRDLTQADLDRWLTDGTSTRRAVRYFLQWAHGRGLASAAVGNLLIQPAKHTNHRLD